MAKLSTSLDMAAIIGEGQAYLAALEAKGFHLPSLEQIDALPVQTELGVEPEIHEFAEAPSAPFIRKP